MESPYAPMHQLWTPPHMTDIICRNHNYPLLNPLLDFLNRPTAVLRTWRNGLRRAVEAPHRSSVRSCWSGMRAPPGCDQPMLASDQGMRQPRVAVDGLPACMDA